MESGDVPASGTLFLPAEIQTQIFEHIMVPSGPRLAVVQVSRQNDALVPGILNATHLRETDAVREIALISRLSRATALFHIQRSALDKPWLQRLGLSRYHIDPETDILFSGVIRGLLPPVNMMGLSLVLGNEFPNIMVNASRFMAFVGSSLVPVDPVATALNSLVSYGGNFANLFANNAQGLPQPGLPRNLFFFLGSYGNAPCLLPPHNQNGNSWCVHFNHLEIVPEHEVDQWVDQALPMVSPRTRQLIQNVRRYWNLLRDQSVFAVDVPNIYFARIPTATGPPTVGAGAETIQTAPASSAGLGGAQINVPSQGGRFDTGSNIPQVQQTPREWFYHNYIPNAEQTFVLKYKARERGAVWDGMASPNEDTSAAGPSDAQRQAFRDWLIANVLPLVEEQGSKKTNESSKS